MVIGSTGILENVFTKDELRQAVKYLSNTSKDSFHLFHRAITPTSILYPWFLKKIVSPVTAFFDTPLNLIFGGYINETIPQKLHSDYYQKTLGEPYKAFLIPISVDNDMSLTDRVHTIVFNEEDTYTDVIDNESKIWKRSNWVQARSPKENNALQYQEQHLSHLNTDDLECLTVNSVLQWKTGNVLYWDEPKLHCSDNFLKNNVKSKQAIIFHTYVL